MKHSSEKDLLIFLQELVDSKILPKKYHKILKDFYFSYKKEINKTDLSNEKLCELFYCFLELIKKQMQKPYIFPPYHRKIKIPFDYYNFGLNFFRPLIDFQHSSTQGLNNLALMQKYIKNKENVILLANHQTESDPMAISLLLEKYDPIFAENIISVAGERVISDPLAIPFSLGCDLLCIYSKKYINIDPARKQDKQLHNKKTMQLLSQLFSEGGKVIYIAPSGGRDRRNDQGDVEIAPFDDRSIELVYLMAKKAKKPSHFFPLALATYDLLPPPHTTQVEMGEKRDTKKVDIHLIFGEEIDMESFAKNSLNKEKTRLIRAKTIHAQVKNLYNNLIKD